MQCDKLNPPEPANVKKMRDMKNEMLKCGEMITDKLIREEGSNGSSKQKANKKR